MNKKRGFGILRKTERIGLALGGGFARGLAHVGVLKVLEEYGVPVHCVAGVSAGAVVGAAFASGATSAEIGRVGAAMRFRDVARWTLSRMGLAGSRPMEGLLEQLLKRSRFEDMPIPLGVVATDLASGGPAVFRDRGDVKLAVRASCSFPGVFQPIVDGDRLLVDGAVSMQVPAEICRMMGATRVISVVLPPPGWSASRAHAVSVVNRCFQIVQARAEHAWRAASDVVITPDVSKMQWNGFGSAEALIRAGEAAAVEALDSILPWVVPEAACA